MIKSVLVASRIVRVYLASTWLLGELIIVYIRGIITPMSAVYFAGSRMSAAVDDRVERKHGQSNAKSHCHVDVDIGHSLHLFTRSKTRSRHDHTRIE